MPGLWAQIARGRWLTSMHDYKAAVGVRLGPRARRRRAAPTCASPAAQRGTVKESARRAISAGQRTVRSGDDTCMTVGADAIRRWGGRPRDAFVARSTTHGIHQGSKPCPRVCFREGNGAPDAHHRNARYAHRREGGAATEMALALSLGHPGVERTGLDGTSAQAIRIGGGIQRGDGQAPISVCSGHRLFRRLAARIPATPNTQPNERWGTFVTPASQYAPT